MYAKVNFLEIGRLHNFQVLNEEMDPKIGMYSKNWVGQVHFENLDFLVKVKGLTWSKHSLSLSLSWQVVQTGSGWTSQIGSAWTNGSDHSGWWCHKDVIDDVIALEGMCQHVARVRAWKKLQCVQVRGWEEWHVFLKAATVRYFGSAWFSFCAWNFQVL